MSAIRGISRHSEAKAHLVVEALRALLSVDRLRQPGLLEICDVSDMATGHGVLC